MKSIIIAAILILGCNYMAFAQKMKQAKVPEAVVQSFKSKFSTATKVRWERESATEFEVNFKQNGPSLSAKFNQSGQWLETESEIKMADLPEAVRNAVAQNFKGYAADEIERVETSDKGLIYEMELKRGKEKWEVQFSPEGTVLKKMDEKQAKD
jgi:hypothetical protein